MYKLGSDCCVWPRDLGLRIRPATSLKEVKSHSSRWANQLPFCPSPSILRPPVIHDGVGGFGQPTGIVAQRLQFHGCKKLGTGGSRAAQRFEQAHGYQHRNIMLVEPQQPGRFFNAQTGGRIASVVLVLCAVCGLITTALMTVMSVIVDRARLSNLDTIN